MRSLYFLLLTTIGFAALPGCQTFQQGPPLPHFINRHNEQAAAQQPDGKKKQKESAQPARMAVIWTDAVYTQPGKPPTRGFGGRIYFYDQHHQSIPVQGDLTVFAYDDTHDKQRKGKVPNREYRYPAQQFAKHYSKSELGHSYSIWIPWDSVDGEQKSISLVPIFEPSSGVAVTGEHTVNLLPGKTLDSDQGFVDTLNSKKLKASTVGFRRGSSVENHGAGPNTSSMQTTTIKLSPSLTKQLQNSTTVPNSKMSRTQVTYGAPVEDWHQQQVQKQVAANTQQDNESQTAATNSRTVFGAPGRMPGQAKPSADLWSRWKQQTRTAHPRSLAPNSQNSVPTTSQPSIYPATTPPGQTFIR